MLRQGRFTHQVVRTSDKDQNKSNIYCRALNTLAYIHTYIHTYCIAQNFRGSLISRIFNCSRKYFNENSWYAACGVRVQRVREIISTKSSKIAIRENLDPRKFSAIRYCTILFIYWSDKDLRNKILLFYYWWKYEVPERGKKTLFGKNNYFGGICWLQ